MAAKQTTNNSPSVELARLLSGQRYTRKHKKKIALIGPAIDRLSSHVNWGNRLSSSFYRTIGLNISLRTITTKGHEPEIDFEFVIWQFSPTLSPSLLKSYLRGTAGLVVVVETLATETTETRDAEHFYSEQEATSVSSEDEVLNIELIEKSADQLKLPVAFIHFVTPEVIEADVTEQGLKGLKGLEGQSEQTNRTKQADLAYLAENEIVNTNQKGEFMCLRETEHSLHLGLSADKHSELCLNQAFDYIAGHFASAA